MRSKFMTIVLVGVIGFLLATNATVSNAAGLVTGKQIKNGSITGTDVKDHSLTAADVKGSLAGPAGPAGPQGAQGAAGAPATALWAVVAGGSTATLARGSGVASVTRYGTGSYGVTFNRSVAGCAYVATAGDVAAGVANADYATVEQRDTTGPTVEVRIVDATGAQVDPSGNDGFHLAVFC